MGDKETEATQQDKVVTEVQTRGTLLDTYQDNCSADTNAAPENKGDSQQEEPSRDGASVQSNKESGDKSAVSPEETAKTTDQDESQEPAASAAENVASKTDVETIGSTSQLESTPNSDVPSSVEDDEGTPKSATVNQECLPQKASAAAEQNISEKDVETIGPPIAPKGVKDGASVQSNKESGDKSAVSPEETAKTTNQDDEGTPKSATVNQERLPQKASAAAEQNVSEKDVETIGPPIAPKGVKDDDILDAASVSSNKESGDKSADSTTAKTTDQDGEGTLESATETQAPLPQEAPGAAKQINLEKDVVTVGPTPIVEPKDVPSIVEDSGQRPLWISVVLVALVAVLVAVLVPVLLKDKDPPQNTDLRQIDIFHREMENLKVKFPSQREELWKRSRIHLQRHFHISQPTEPVSIILTAGVRAEGTLRCLAQSIASALSSALNVSALDLDGVSKSSQDSDKVKSDIDSQLQKAFEEGKPIAVIHRFEELPPASTLIFYRYCDHENAAFKKTFLIFTVLLGEEEEIQAKIRLSEVEEMVTDHLQKKFLSHGHPSAFDKMDIDKYGGLWSRISHLILPVATEKRIEKTHQC